MPGRTAGKDSTMPCDSRLFEGREWSALELAPQGRRTSGLFDCRKACHVGGKFLFAGCQHGRALTISRQTTDRAGLGTTAGIVRTIPSQGQVGLPASHGQPDVGKNLGVQQGAVQIAAGVIDPIALAQRVEAVALARVPLTRHQQGIEHRAVVGDLGAVTLPEQGELVVDEADIERRVVNHQLRVADDLEKLVGDITEARLVSEKLVGDPVNRHCALIDLAIRLQIDMEMPPGKTPADHLDAANFNHSVTIGHRHACRFGIQNYHPVSIRFVNRHSALAPK